MKTSLPLFFFLGFCVMLPAQRDQLRQKLENWEEDLEQRQIVLFSQPDSIHEYALDLESGAWILRKRIVFEYGPESQISWERDYRKGEYSGSRKILVKWVGKDRVEQDVSFWTQSEKAWIPECQVSETWTDDQLPYSWVRREYDPKSNTWEPACRLWYDWENGQLMSVRAQEWDDRPQNWTPFMLVSLCYGPEGNRQSTETFRYAGEWEQVAYSIEYHPADSISFSRFHRWNFFEWVEAGFGLEVRDEAGKVLERIKADRDIYSLNWKSPARKRYAYDRNGQLIAILEEAWTGSRMDSPQGQDLDLAWILPGKGLLDDRNWMPIRKTEIFPRWMESGL